MGDQSISIRHSDQELDIILETVIEMIVKGYSSTNIVLHFKEDKSLHRTERTIHNYIKSAKIEIKERFSCESDELMALAAFRYEDLYKKNYAIQDYRECRNVQDSFNKLVGLNAPIRSELSIAEPKKLIIKINRNEDNQIKPGDPISLD